ncbi:MAG: Gfo/Idh/MocA family protein [Clostridia bacterium]
MKKIKWGVIGCGGIADRRTIPGMMLAENAELVAVMDANPDFAEKVREKYNAKYAFTDMHELLALDEIEAVYIASPVTFHKEQALAAADAGKHILIEKPVSLTTADAEEIAAYCKKAGVKLGVGFMMRFHAYHEEMKKLIAEGKLGDIVSMRGQLTCWYPEMPGNWRQAKKTAGGGSMMDMGIHCIDVLQYITGLKAKKVAGFASNLTFGYEVEDSSNAVIQMDNGSVMYIDANFNIPDAAARCRLEIYGTRGSILAEGTISQVEGGKVDICISDDSLGYDAQQDRVDVKNLELDVTFGNMYTKEIERFGNAILNDTEAPVTAEEAIFNQKIVEAVYESSTTGHYVSL